MFICPIYYHNWRNISTIYMYNKTSIKGNILTIKQNTSVSRSGYGLISTSVCNNSQSSYYVASYCGRRAEDSLVRAVSRHECMSTLILCTQQPIRWS